MRDLSKQSFLGGNVEEILATKVIGVIGVNGGGSHLVQQAASIGFRNFVLSDPGFTDQKKLNRNVLATLEHANKKVHKIDVAIERILSLNPDAQITPVRDKWQIGAEKGLFDKCHALLGAVDTFSERDQVERFSRTLKVPYADIGMDIRALSNGRHAIFGQAIMTFPNGPCMRCLGFLSEELLELEANNYGDAGDRPQVVWPNGSLASAAIGFLMDYFFDWTGNRPNYLYRQYDGNRFELKDFEHAKLLLAAMKGKCPHF